jgi:hypothetical protein
MVVRWLELPFVRADFEFGGPSEDGLSAKIWEPVQNRGSFLGPLETHSILHSGFFRTGPHFGVTAGVALTATSAETTTPNLSPAAKRTLNHSYNAIPATTTANLYYMSPENNVYPFLTPVFGPSSSCKEHTSCRSKGQKGKQTKLIKNPRRNQFSFVLQMQPNRYGPGPVSTRLPNIPRVLPSEPSSETNY